MVVSCLKNALLWGQKISKTSFVLGERTRFRHESENPNWSIIIWVLAPSMSEHIKGQIGSFYTVHKFTIILVVTVTGVTHAQDIKIWSINKLFYIWLTGSWKPVLGELKITRTKRKDSHRWRDCSNLEDILLSAKSPAWIDANTFLIESGGISDFAPADTGIYRNLTYKMMP